MHELSVCQAIVREVLELAAARCATSISDIYLRVGPLSGVETPLLRNAFPFAAAGTVVSGAALHVAPTPVRIHCSRCDADTVVPPNRLLCGQCSDWRTELLSGDELLLDRIEMQCSDEKDHAHV
ncbi:MAG: hydrogenase maturation nickel metallochaperone HypA [Gammaproteobacteria bacterium]|nr:hydrogenase maturation nickel metallochaperone HypA [Gammaproteobacteria bacterium]MDH4314145.1 hydrogenase maturation nickel metallochaperone HypA [Gammaproteobacteria bacterium]MDH5212785.1 hydrogenase maturation nickel metallochaperone HypA [Gammaproteobacteria bacterium]MDH5500731.1 hydrogenase maturation nickel metallochaperone HypA [Gammaproteobacteria bacterium]